MSFDIETSPSVLAFKEDLIRVIPYVPNTGEAREVLRKCEVSTLVHIFHMWRQRFIVAQPRRFVVPRELSIDPLYVKHKAAIDAIKEKVERGDSLDGYLSMQIDRGTFNVDKFVEDGDFQRSRDEMLITEGFHHMHLVEKPARSDELLVVWDTGDTLELVGIVTHAIFDDMTFVRSDADYQRYVDSFLARKYPEGAFLLGGPGGGMVNMAGSSVWSTMFQIDVYKLIRAVETFPDGLEGGTKSLYRELLGRNPQFVDPKWVMDKVNGLGIRDKKNKVNFWCTRKGKWSAEPYGPQKTPTPDEGVD
jgi:hypothetical protein